MTETLRKNSNCLKQKHSKRKTILSSLRERLGRMFSSDKEEVRINLKDDIAPEIKLKQSEADDSGGRRVRITGNQLLFDDEVIAKWKDDRTKKCKVVVKLGGQEIKPGDVLNQAGTITLRVTNEKGYQRDTDITLHNEAIYGLENLQNLSMQVDQEVNLLNGISIADGVSIVKVEIVIDGQRNEVKVPAHFVPEYPGVCSIIFTIKDKNGGESEVNVDNLEIKGIEYKAV